MTDLQAAATDAEARLAALEEKVAAGECHSPAEPLHRLRVRAWKHATDVFPCDRLPRRMRALQQIFENMLQEPLLLSRQAQCA